MPATWIIRGLHLRAKLFKKFDYYRWVALFIIISPKCVIAKMIEKNLATPSKRVSGSHDMLHEHKDII